jgi:hypothetical protein
VAEQHQLASRATDGLVYAMAYGRRNDPPMGILITLVVWFTLAWNLHRWWGILGAVLIIAGFLFCVDWYSRCKERREEKHRATEPCVHRVKGAKYNIDLCPTCAAERDRNYQQYQREKEAKHRAELLERKKRYSEWIAKVRLPEYVKKIDPQEFETLICRLFRRMGYRVEQTPYVGDNGSDGYLFKGEEKTVLQCKRVQGSVGEPVLRDLFGTMHATKCTNAIVVTTGTVSKQARKWIDGKPIRIIELEELQELFREHFKEGDVVPDGFTPAGLAAKQCPRCGNALRVVNGRNGRFIGCTKYPACHYTAQADRDGMPIQRSSRFRRRRS